MAAIATSRNAVSAKLALPTRVAKARAVRVSAQSSNVSVNDGAMPSAIEVYPTHCLIFRVLLTSTVLK